MPLKKFVIQPGINKERTRYAGEGQWYDCDKVRFRKGFPEKIGGWQRFSSDTFLGVCRSLFNWVTLSGLSLWGVGTHLKFYIARGGTYYDVTPIRATNSLGSNPVSTTSGSTTVQITDTAHGAIQNDFVTLSGLTGPVGGVPAGDLNQEHQITTIIDADTYEIEVDTTATSTATGGGASGQAEYQINVGPEIPEPLEGYGSGGYGLGTYGNGLASAEALRLWSQDNFGEDLLFCPREGGIYFWDATNGTGTRGTLLSSESGASNVPTTCVEVFVSDNRFVFAFGCNPIGSGSLDPLLVRWTDQESSVDWTPTATNQSGSLRLSIGSEILTAQQARQEVLVWTDAALYSMSYLGGTDGWGALVVGDNISLASPNAVAYANGIAYWMGRDKFYFYDGRVQTLRCDLLRYVFDDINLTQDLQIFAGTNEAFDEIWWFYVLNGDTTVSRYVVYNYAQDVWYHGNLDRTAWADAGTAEYPMAATYSNNLVQHELGVDDLTTATAQAIAAEITSAQFDLEDGDRFMLITRILPDVTFEGSSAASPAVTVALQPLKNSGSGRNNPLSEGGNSDGAVTRMGSGVVEEFTEQIYVRIRGRQASFKISSDGEGVAWQLGAPRFDMRPSGRR